MSSTRRTSPQPRLTPGSRPRRSGHCQVGLDSEVAQSLETLMNENALSGQPSTLVSTHTSTTLLSFKTQHEEDLKVCHFPCANFLLSFSRTPCLYQFLQTNVDGVPSIFKMSLEIVCEVHFCCDEIFGCFTRDFFLQNSAYASDREL